MPDATGKFKGATWNDVPWAVIWIVQLIVGVAMGVYVLVLRRDNLEEALAGRDWGETLMYSILAMVVAVIVAIALFFLIKYFTRQFIYVANIFYICLVVVLAALSFFFLHNMFAGIFLVAFALLYALWFFAARNRIPFATLMLQAACNITAKYPAILLWSFVMMTLTCGVAVLLFLALLVLKGMSIGLVIIPAFMFYWSSEVFQNLCYTAACGVAASWYFLQDQASNPTLGAIYRTCTTSFGSICLGSLVVAILKTIRLLLRFARDQAASEGGPCGFVGCFFLCCLECIIHQIEALLQYFNEYAYAHVAIYGKKYTSAARDTLSMLEQNGLVAIINDNLLGTVFILCTVFCGCLTGLVAGLVSWDWATAVVGLCAGLYVTSILLSVLNANVITIFVCFAEQPEALRLSNPELFAALHRADTGGDVETGAPGQPQPHVSMHVVGETVAAPVPHGAAPCKVDNRPASPVACKVAPVPGAQAETVCATGAPLPTAAAVPFPPVAGPPADTDGLAKITGMGFTEEQAKDALQKCNNNVEAAIESLVG
mmetsp:Transcript_77298/g.136310  ORF Transcript_77298/g.136310 Transcript_77298/m.136310 type:complete len:543 (-) Transcript_77298:305-1933(-)